MRIRVLNRFNNKGFVVITDTALPSNLRVDSLRKEPEIIMKTYKVDVNEGVSLIGESDGV